MEDITVYIVTSDEVSKDLGNNKIDITKFLNQVDSSAKYLFSSMDIEGEKNSSKDIVPIIIASAASITGILLGLSRLLDSYFNRSHFYEWEELELIEKNEFNHQNSSEIPKWKKVKKHAVLNPEKSIYKTSFEVNAGIKGIVFKITTSKN